MKAIFFLLLTVLVISGFSSHAQSRDKKLNEFLILGTLNDYMGREFNPGDSTLFDRYYNPSEVIMIAKVDSLIKVTYPKKVYDGVEKTESTINSDFLAKRFNAFYDFSPSGMRTVWGMNILRGKLKDDIFHNEQEKLSFLAGAYLRFGNRCDSAYYLSLPNSDSKANLCNKLLKELGCRPLYHIQRNIPSGHYVFFHPTPKVLAYMKRYEQPHERYPRLVLYIQRMYKEAMLNESKQKPDTN
ncbi:MAG: hypothetical protein JWR38_4965 [Mucilaginibacter sp.]|nr:hypothetical protein [Mucilaginibacter sp.]